MIIMDPNISRGIGRLNKESSDFGCFTVTIDKVYIDVPFGLIILAGVVLTRYEKVGHMT